MGFTWISWDLDFRLKGISCVFHKNSRDDIVNFVGVTGIKMGFDSTV